MAFAGTVVTGESGVVKIATQAVASVRSFTVDSEQAIVETTSMDGNGSRSYLPSLNQFSGSMDVYYDDDDAGQVASITNIQATGSAAVAVELYPSGETTGAKLSGNIIVTGHSITSSMDGVVEASITFQGTGPLTIGATT
jgi:predicted secreted protein